MPTNSLKSCNVLLQLAWGGVERRNVRKNMFLMVKPLCQMFLCICPPAVATPSCFFQLRADLILLSNILLQLGWDGVHRR